MDICTTETRIIRAPSGRLALQHLVVRTVGIFPDMAALEAFEARLSDAGATARATPRASLQRDVTDVPAALPIPVPDAAVPAAATPAQEDPAEDAYAVALRDIAGGMPVGEAALAHDLPLPVLRGKWSAVVRQMRQEDEDACRPDLVQRKQPLGDSLDMEIVEAALRGDAALDALADRIDVPRSRVHARRRAIDAEVARQMREGTGC